MKTFTQTQMFSYFVQERLIRQEDDIFDRKVLESLTKRKERDSKNYLSLQKIDSVRCIGK